MSLKETMTALPSGTKLFGRKGVPGTGLMEGAFLLCAVSALVLFVFAPLCEVFWRAFVDSRGNWIAGANFVTYFSTPYLFSSFLNTLYVATVTALWSVTLAFGYAYAVCRTDMPLRSFFRHVVFLPLFAPTMMHGIGMVYLFGNKGLLTALGLRVGLYGPVGIILSEIVYTFPQAFLILLISLSTSDYRLYEAAESLGADSLRKFRTVTLPGVKYGLANAFIVSFILAFTDFGAPKVVGGNYNVLATDIYKQVIGQQNFSMGATVGILLLLPAVVAFCVEQYMRRQQGGVINARSVPYRVRPDKMRDAVAFLYCGSVAFCIVGLLGVVVFAALVKVWPYTLSPTLDHFSFRYVAGNGLETYLNSIAVAAASAVAGTLFVFCAAYLFEKTRRFIPARRVGRFLALLPLALPGLVIGLAYIFFFNRTVFPLPGGIVLPNPFRGLYGSAAILVLANVVHFLSVAFLTATTALRKLDDEFEQVGESLGVPFYRIFTAVTVPMCLPAIFEIALYFFVNAMVTISAVVFLYPPGFKLASVAIVNMTDAGDIAPAAAMSVLIVLTNIAVRAVFEGVTGSVRRRTAVWMRSEGV